MAELKFMRVFDGEQSPIGQPELETAALRFTTVVGNMLTIHGLKNSFADIWFPSYRLLPGKETPFAVEEVRVCQDQRFGRAEEIKLWLGNKVVRYFITEEGFVARYDAPVEDPWGETLKAKNYAEEMAANMELERLMGVNGCDVGLQEVQDLTQLLGTMSSKP